MMKGETEIKTEWIYVNSTNLLSDIWNQDNFNEKQNEKKTQNW